MKKPIIAVDIDDVIAANAEGFVEWSNKTFGTNLTIDDYTEHWALVWKVDHEVMERRSVNYHASGHLGTYNHIDGALEVLNKLKQNYKLIVITSRRISTDQITRNWINNYYPNIFDEIIFTGFFDTMATDRHHLTKAELAKFHLADYLIDDQLKHCQAAAEVGVESILFGEYSWNKCDTLPQLVSRCRNWQEVNEFFIKRGLLN